MEKENYKLCEGKLGSLDNGTFEHSWIETENSIYDVSFIGKWPKDAYYDLFQPIIEKEIPKHAMEDDEKFSNFKANLVSAEKIDNSPSLTYIDWYNYFRRIKFSTPFMPAPPLEWLDFPVNQSKENDMSELEQMIDEPIDKKILVYWQQNFGDNLDEIPNEIFSNELHEHIKERKYLKEPEELYLELTEFIGQNKELYNEKKETPNDLTLWKKAIDDKYSGSLCELLSVIPKIVESQNKERSTAKK